MLGLKVGLKYLSPAYYRIWTVSFILLISKRKIYFFESLRFLLSKRFLKTFHLKILDIQRESTMKFRNFSFLLFNCALLPRDA